MTAITIIKTAINKALLPVGLKVIRNSHDWNDQRQYLPVAETVNAAQAAGMTVGDYIDITYNFAGATDFTINEMDKLGIFDQKLDHVVEIGPGSGRYLAHIVKRCNPANYEIYETAKPWAEYLVKSYGVIEQPTQGTGMKTTPDVTADLVHAHKVFCSVSFLISVRYWPEMIRVVKPGGYIVFDVMTESCLDAETADAWAATHMEGIGTYPSIMPRSFVLDYFASHGVALIGSFLVPMKPGSTETFVFRKMSR